jgi:hypothetical protein
LQINYSALTLVYIIGWEGAFWGGIGRDVGDGLNGIGEIVGG